MECKEIQTAFMQHIRDPENHHFDGVEDRRLAIYRELFFNNVEGFVSSGFPVLRSLYEKPQWLTLVRQFFSLHDCQSPYFLHIAQEFIEFLSEQYQVTENDPPYLLELAHYEWVELAISIKDKAINEHPISSDSLAHMPLRFSSLAMRVSYQYPVQFAASDNRDLAPMPQGNHLVVYRDQDDDIQFLAINALTAIMLEQIEQSNGMLFNDLLATLSLQFPQFSESQLKQGLIQTLTDLANKQIIVAN